MRRVWPVLALLCISAACAGITGSEGDHYEGSFSGITYTETAIGGNGVSCGGTSMLSGRVELDIEQSNGQVTGEGNAFFQEIPASGSCTPPQRKFDMGGPLTGTLSNFEFSNQYTSTGAGVVDTTRVRFTGSLSGTSGSGTVTLTYSGRSRVDLAGIVTGGATFNVTLSR